MTKQCQHCGGVTLLRDLDGGYCLTCGWHVPEPEPELPDLAALLKGVAK